MLRVDDGGAKEPEAVLPTVKADDAAIRPNSPGR
jgi:hypothetical protein